MPMSRRLNQKISNRILIDCPDLCLTQEILIGYHILQNIFATMDRILVTFVLSWKGLKMHLITIEIFYKSSERNTILSSKRAIGLSTKIKTYVRRSNYPTSKVTYDTRKHSCLAKRRVSL